MGAISSPLQTTGLLKTNCAGDKGIYSIYRFIDTDENDRMYFGIFYSKDNDMHQPWFKDVVLLWEKGKITDAGNEFINENWQLHSVHDDNGVLEMSYINKNGTIMTRRGGTPIGEDGKEIPKSLWPPE